MVETNLKVEIQSLLSIKENQSKLSLISKVQHYFPIYYVWVHTIPPIRANEVQN